MGLKPRHILVIGAGAGIGLLWAANSLRKKMATEAATSKPPHTPEPPTEPEPPPFQYSSEGAGILAKDLYLRPVAGVLEQGKKFEARPGTGYLFPVGGTLYRFMHTSGDRLCTIMTQDRKRIHQLRFCDGLAGFAVGDWYPEGHPDYLEDVRFWIDTHLGQQAFELYKKGPSRISDEELASLVRRVEDPTVEAEMRLQAILRLRNGGEILEVIKGCVMIATDKSLGSDSAARRGAIKTLAELREDRLLPAEDVEGVPGSVTMWNVVTTQGWEIVRSGSNKDALDVASLFLDQRSFREEGGKILDFIAGRNDGDKEGKARVEAARKLGPLVVNLDRWLDAWQKIAEDTALNPEVVLDAIHVLQQSSHPRKGKIESCLRLLMGRNDAPVESRIIAAEQLAETGQAGEARAFLENLMRNGTPREKLAAMESWVVQHNETSLQIARETCRTMARWQGLRAVFRIRAANNLIHLSTSSTAEGLALHREFADSKTSLVWEDSQLEKAPAMEYAFEDLYLPCETVTQIARIYLASNDSTLRAWGEKYLEERFVVGKSDPAEMAGEP